MSPRHFSPALQRQLWGLCEQWEGNRHLPIDRVRASWQVEVKTVRRPGLDHVGLDSTTPRRGEQPEWLPYVTFFDAATATAFARAIFENLGIPARPVVHTLGPTSTELDVERLAVHVRKLGTEAIAHAQRGRPSPFLEVG